MPKEEERGVRLRALERDKRIRERMRETSVRKASARESDMYERERETRE